MTVMANKLDDINQDSVVVVPEELVEVVPV
jgi:hypothetical protein